MNEYKISKGTEGTLITVNKHEDQVIINYDDWTTRQGFTFLDKHLVCKPGDSRGTAIPKFAAQFAKKGMIVFKQIKQHDGQKVHFLAIAANKVTIY